MQAGAWKRYASAWLLVAACSWVGSAAQAASITGDLTVEFDNAVVAAYGTATATEDGAGGLDFSISLSGELGDRADLHVFYFNLIGTFSGVAISDTNAPYREYRIGERRPVRGGAGHAFDYRVHFGNGAGRRGNGVLQLATFKITADQALGVDDLLEVSAKRADIGSQFAAHIQGTNTHPGSETVGGLWDRDPPPGGDAVPEPGTFFLTGLGIAGLGLQRRRRG